MIAAFSLIPILAERWRLINIARTSTPRKKNRRCGAPDVWAGIGRGRIFRRAHPEWGHWAVGRSHFITRSNHCIATCCRHVRSVASDAGRYSLSKTWDIRQPKTKDTNVRNSSIMLINLISNNDTLFVEIFALTNFRALSRNPFVQKYAKIKVYLQSRGTDCKIGYHFYT